MTNRDVLNRSNPKEIEQMLGYLLLEYWDKLKEHGNLDKCHSSPINTVSMYKNFLKEETLIDTEIYDRMYPKNDQVVVDVDFVEIENVESDDIER